MTLLQGPGGWSTTEGSKEFAALVALNQLNVKHHREATQCPILFAALQQSAFSLEGSKLVLNPNVRRTVINTVKHH